MLRLCPLHRTTLATRSADGSHPPIQRQAQTHHARTRFNSNKATISITNILLLSNASYDPSPPAPKRTPPPSVLKNTRAPSSPRTAAPSAKEMQTVSQPLLGRIITRSSSAYKHRGRDLLSPMTIQEG